MEALDAMEAALCLCEEAVSEGHTLAGPWETQEVKASDQVPKVQASVIMQEHRDEATVSALMPVGKETRNQQEAKRREPLKGNSEAPTVTSSISSDDGAVGIEVTELELAGKVAIEAVVKSEGEDWSYSEANPPCLGECSTQNEILIIYSRYVFFIWLSELKVINIGIFLGKNKNNCFIIVYILLCIVAVF